MSEIYVKRVKSIALQLNPEKKTDIESLFSQFSHSQNGEFAEAILEKGLIKEIELLSNLSNETLTQIIDISKLEIRPDVLELVTQEEAQRYSILPISKLNDLLTIVVVDPYNIELFDLLRNRLKCTVRPVLTFRKALQETIKRAYNPEQAQIEEVLTQAAATPETENITIEQAAVEAEREINLQELQKEDSPVIKVLNMIVMKSLKDSASDIHVEPFEKQTRVRMRVDGSLRETNILPKSIHNSLVSRIKIISDLNIAERRIPQDGKFQVKYENRQIDVRVSVLPTIFGEKVVCRLLDSKNLNKTIDQLGFEKKAEEIFRKSITSSYGMILVTGPTGSGKSTTLYASLREVINPTENIVTVEDPVEYQFEGINQVSVNSKKGLTFAASLRSILRQDPDTIMIGEIRDAETADIAVKAAITGHLVLSTLHTNDAPSTITRLIDMGVDKFMVASSLICVSAQRLLRRLCKFCKKPTQPLPPVSYLKQIGFKDEDMQNLTLSEPVGCSACTEGYKGRFAILEALEINDTIRKMIIQGSSHLDIKQYSIKEMEVLTLRRCAILNAMRGHTSLQEVLNMTMADDM
ncbi:MAG: Flp pilus assembly complex ATPase component TadA [Planctomycetes bacterium]|nr:Flp pilus assembly complex ATPase component TadA [Planctomycetota bacterium]